MLAKIPAAADFSPLISTGHKSPVDGKQRLAGRLDVTCAHPVIVIFHFQRRFVEIKTALIAGPILAPALMCRAQANFIRMRRTAGGKVGGGKTGHVEANQVRRITGGEIEIGVKGRMVKIFHVMPVILAADGHVALVAIALGVINSAGEMRIINEAGRGGRGRK
ncbi:hypothetical protein D3C71_835870 [compost metagenome]